MTIKSILVIEDICQKHSAPENGNGSRRSSSRPGSAFINKVGIRLLVVDDVAREAGISKGSFYSFFPSREEFILSVFESWETEYRGALIHEVSEGAGTARERIERFFLGTFEILEREPGLAQPRHEGYPDDHRAASARADRGAPGCRQPGARGNIRQVAFEGPSRLRISSAPSGVSCPPSSRSPCRRRTSRQGATNRR